jgi:hypothetical protein
MYGSNDVSKVTPLAWHGQGLDAIVVFRPLRPICIFIRTRMLFALCMLWIFVLYIWIFWLVESSWLYYIFFFGFHRELVQLLLLDSTRITCTPQHAQGARWCISEATSCRLWHDSYNLQGIDFGASQWGWPRVRMRDAPNQIQGNDWMRHGLAPMTTTHIVCSCYEEWLI